MRWEVTFIVFSTGEIKLENKGNNRSPDSNVTFYYTDFQVHQQLQTQTHSLFLNFT